MTLIFLRWVCHQTLIKPVAVCTSRAKAEAVKAKLVNAASTNDLEVAIVEVPLCDDLQIDPSDEIAKWN